MRMLIVILILTFSCSVKGQPDFLTKNGTYYFYKDKKYKCKDLGPVYEQYRASYDHYVSGRKYKAVGQTSAYIGLGFIIAGVAVAPGVSLQNERSGFVIIGIGLIFELAAIAPIIIGRQKLKNAMDTFNFGMIKKHGYKSNLSLSFGSTENGLGLVLNI